MEFEEIRKLYYKSKHSKIINVIYWENDKQYQVNYKSGKTCFYCMFEDLPKTVKEFLWESNEKHKLHWSGDYLTFYFCI